MKYLVDRWVARARGPFGRLARGWLVLAGDRGDNVAIDAVWELWLDEPDPRLWAALARWRRPHTRGGLSRVALGEATEPADIAEAACRSGHPVARIARARILAGQQDLVDAACEKALSTQDKGLVAFCVEHHLAPSEAPRAALFFLLTGQDEKYRLADPDHSLLALAYQAASGDIRSRVRARAAGDTDLVRALTDTVRRGRLARLGVREAEYLVDEVAARQDWAGVWHLAKDLPVVDAAAAVRRCAGWRPAGHDAELFDALAAVEPAALAESYRDAVRPRRLPVAGSFRGSMSPDGRRIAVAAPRFVDVFADSDVPERVPTTLHPRLLALDGDVLIVSSTDPEQADGFTAHGYVAPGSASGICRFHRAGTLARTPDGFAVLAYEEEKRTHWLHLLSGSGWDFHRYEHRVLNIRAELGIVRKYPHEMFTMAVEPGSGRLAVASDDGLHLAEITGGRLRSLATAPVNGGMLRHLAFCGPARLIRLTWGGKLQLWRLDGDAPRVVAERDFIDDAADLPGAGVIAAIPKTGRGPQRVHYLDGETLADVPAPAQFYDRGEPDHLFVSPDGDRLGVGYSEFAEVVDAAMIVLADRPLAATTPPDLHAARARLDRDSDSVFLGLLHACLAHRFGGDVALGDDGMIIGGADDIALGGSA